MVLLWTFLAVLIGPSLSGTALIQGQGDHACAAADAYMDIGQFDTALTLYAELVRANPPEQCAVDALADFKATRVAWHLDRARQYEDQGHKALADAEYATAAAIEPTVSAALPTATATPEDIFSDVTDLDDHGFPDAAEARLLEVVSTAPASPVPATLRHLDQDPNNDFGDTTESMLDTRDRYAGWFATVGVAKEELAIVGALLALATWFLWPRRPRLRR